MKYIEAVERIKSLNCHEASQAAIEPTNDPIPPENLESTILCKIKIARDEDPDACYVIDESYCPLNRKG